MVSHRYDYEPVFIYLKRREGGAPYFIVNKGFGGPVCRFTNIEIRPKSGKRDTFDVFFETNLAPAPYYPFGKEGKVKFKGCSRRYPLNRGDLDFKDLHPLFGIRSCSNVFSGARHDLQGEIFDSTGKKAH